jgi:hypothetical protein
VTALDEHEGDDQHGGDNEARQHPPRRPAPAAGLDQREHEGHRAEGDRDRPLSVMAGPRGRLDAALRDDPRSQSQHHDADRHVDKKDPAPAERLNDRAAEQQADRAARARDRTPDRQRAVALWPLGEGREDDR